MLGNKFYYDDPEGDALAKETSHPKYVENMTADFYYDCTHLFPKLVKICLTTASLSFRNCFANCLA